MSGIFGAVLLNGKYKDALNKERMTALLSKMATGSQVRGKDATGLAVIGNDKIRTIKRGIAAGAFVESSEFKDFLKSVNLSTTYSFIGHCRDATKGSNKDYNNNSPMVCGDVVGAHNGFIANDDDLFKSYSAEFSREAKTDCEIVFKLLNHWQGTTGFKVHRALQKVSKATTGTSAYACANALAPSVMCLVRNVGNPLDVKVYADSGLVLFGSSEYYLEEAAKVASMGDSTKLMLPVGKALLICAEKNEFAEVDLK